MWFSMDSTALLNLIDQLFHTFSFFQLNQFGSATLPVPVRNILTDFHDWFTMLFPPSYNVIDSIIAFSVFLAADPGMDGEPSTPPPCIFSQNS